MRQVTGTKPLQVHTAIGGAQPSSENSRALDGHHSTRQSKALPLCRPATIKLKLQPGQRQTDRPTSQNRDHASHPDRRATKLAIDVPRDRQSSFDPQLIAKYQRRFPGFDDKIVSMYARDMSTREITRHLHDLYGIDVSPDLISTVTDAVLDEVATSQQRPLDPVYPLVFFDAIRVKIRDEGMVRNKAIHIALGVRADGAKEVLGLWLEQNEGAKFWLWVMNELRNRGVEDILLAVVDGLKGFPDVITAGFPDAIVQTCMFTCCATRWNSSPGRTARTSPARSRRFTVRPRGCCRKGADGI